MASSKRKKIILLICVIIVLIIAALTVFFILRSRGIFNQVDLPDTQWDLPGSSLTVGEDWTVDQERSDKLERRILELCKTEYGLVEWYQLPVRSESLPSVQSSRLRASDQLLYGQYLIEQNRLEDFSDWHLVFSNNFLYDGNVAEFIEVDEQGQIIPSDYSWESALEYANVLMRAYQIKPQNKIWQELESLSEYLLTEFSDGIPESDLQLAVPTVAPAPDPAATPTPVPIITPSPEPAPVYGLIKLSSINLHTISQLTTIDSRWQQIYDKWLLIVDDGLISDQTPMYALAVWPDLENYLNFTGDSGAVDSRESIASMLNLAQVDHIDQRPLRWVNDQILNNFAIYESYNIIQGHPMSQVEDPSVYALTARIARLADDKTLYDNSVNRLVWHTATNQRSEALDAVFRQDEDGIVTVWTQDNLLALLAYR